MRNVNLRIISQLVWLCSGLQLTDPWHKSVPRHHQHVACTVLVSLHICFPSSQTATVCDDMFNQYIYYISAVSCFFFFSMFLSCSSFLSSLLSSVIITCVNAYMIIAYFLHIFFCHYDYTSSSLSKLRACPCPPEE